MFSRVGRPRVWTETRGRVNIAQRHTWRKRMVFVQTVAATGPSGERTRMSLIAHALRQQYLKPRRPH